MTECEDVSSKVGKKAMRRPWFCHSILGRCSEMILRTLWLTGFCICVTSSPLSRALTKCDPREGPLNSCIAKNLNVIVPSLSSGWEWMNVPSLNPLFLSPTITTGYHDGNMTLDLVLRNTSLIGITRTITRVVKSKAIEEGKLEVLTNSPKITCVGQYTSEGLLAGFPLHSDGRFNITLTDVNSVWIINLEKIVMDGKDYFQVKNLILDAMPVQITIKAADYFDDRRDLGKNFNVFLNNNSFELYNLVKPNLMKYFGELFKGMINSLLIATPENLMFSGVEISNFL